MFKVNYKMMKLLCAVSMCFNMSTVLADQVPEKSIFELRISVSQSAELKALLARVPVWQPETIQALFPLYLDTLKGKSAKESAVHNGFFVNSYWGALQNSFNKYPRPAKLFAFTADNRDSYFTALIVQNASDQQYYVLDYTKNQPMILSHWLSTVAGRNNSAATLKVNICEKYAIYPKDACGVPQYDDEVDASHQLYSRGILADQASIPSAYRSPTTDWHAIKPPKSLSVSYESSIYHSAVRYNDVTARNAVLQNATAWPNAAVISANFEKLRDTRFFADPSRQTFLRRLSWLYPDDGCWTRAAAVIKAFFGSYMQNPVNSFARPARIFAFGNLCVNTKNHPEGAVTWWYHVAPIVKDAETGAVYVLDPAVEPKQPLLATEWVDRISAQQGVCGRSYSSVATINVCDAYGTGPYDACHSVGLKHEAVHTLGQRSYLKMERARQKELGRNVDAVLGDAPPWVVTKS